jgi:hypothetical protein
LIVRGKDFQNSLLSQPLSKYLNNQDGGAAKILPEIDVAMSFKAKADGLLT